MLTAGQRVWGGSAPRGEAAELCPGNARTAVERSRTAIPASGQRHLPDPSLRLPDPSLRPGQGSYCRAAALHAGRSRRGPAHHGSGTRSCAGGRQDRRTRLTGLSREGFQGTGAVRIQGGNRNEVLHGMRRSRPRPAVLHALRRGVKSPARPGRRPVPDHHRSRPDPSRTGPGGAARPALGPAGITRARPVRIRSAAGPAVPSRSARGAAAFA